MTSGPTNKGRKTASLTKVTDVEFRFRCTSGEVAIYREEVYVDSVGRVAKYNLALIHFGKHQGDHGRVLGYDNAHGRHERHFMGEVDVFEFKTYKEVLERFIAEVKHHRETA